MRPVPGPVTAAPPELVDRLLAGGPPPRTAPWEMPKEWSLMSLPSSVQCVNGPGTCGHFRLRSCPPSDGVGRLESEVRDRWFSARRRPPHDVQYSCTVLRRPRAEARMLVSRRSVTPDICWLSLSTTRHAWHTYQVSQLLEPPASASAVCSRPRTYRLRASVELRDPCALYAANPPRHIYPQLNIRIAPRCDRRRPRAATSWW